MDKKQLVDFFIQPNDYKKYIIGNKKFTLTIMDYVKLDGIIDEFTKEESFEGIPIIHDLSKINEHSIVLNCVLGWSLTVRDKFDQYHILSVDVWALHQYSNIPVVIDYFDGFGQVYNDRKKEFDDVMSMLMDNESKDTFQRLVRFKNDYDLEQLSVFRNREKNQYFEDFLNLKEEGEVFVDTGGYDGKTSLDFITRYPQYSKIYYFEPEKELMSQSQLRLKNYSKIQFIEAGAYSTDGTVKFNSEDFASSICEDGEQQINVVKIDNICDGIHPVTFIKMDIEGAERDAIQGARQVIMRDHPRLAISVYHRLDDFVEIPPLVMSIRTDYDIYLRHYTECSVETIMFFIPKK